MPELVEAPLLLAAILSSIHFWFLSSCRGSYSRSASDRAVRNFFTAGNKEALSCIWETISKISFMSGKTINYIHGRDCQTLLSSLLTAEIFLFSALFSTSKLQYVLKRTEKRGISAGGGGGGWGGMKVVESSVWQSRPWT